MHRGIELKPWFFKLLSERKGGDDLLCPIYGHEGKQRMPTLVCLCVFVCVCMCVLVYCVCYKRVFVCVCVCVVRCYELPPVAIAQLLQRSRRESGRGSLEP